MAVSINILSTNKNNKTIFLGQFICKHGTVKKANERCTYFLKMVYKKGKGLDLGAEPPLIKFCCTPTPQPLQPGGGVGVGGINWAYRQQIIL